MRPLGSEKLNGDEKLKRILELTYWGETQKKPSYDKPEFVTESKIGGVYGIVKEKDGFYVKKGLNESSLEYIGGMFMKNKNRFSSYGEAFKRLEFLKGQDILQEATKYVLKQNKPPMEAPTPAPAMSEPPAPENTDIPPIPTGDEPSPEDEMPMSDEGGEENLRSGYMEAIQKWSGKLGQELRDQKEKLESDDIKYVLNMVISAIDLQKLEDDDMEEIASKFDREDEEFEDPESEPSNNEFDVPEPSANDSELNEFDEFNFDDDEPMSKLSEFINSSPDEESLFGKYSMDSENDEFNEQDLAGDEFGGDEFGGDEFGDDEVVMHHDAEPELERKPQPKFRTKPVEEKPNVREFDMDEITDKVNRMIKDNFSKYFDQ